MDIQVTGGLQTKVARFTNPQRYCYFDTEHSAVPVSRPNSIIETSALSSNLCKLGSVGIKYLIVYY